MGTLWSFGDSFADTTRRGYKDDNTRVDNHYLNQIATELNYKHMPLALAGTGLEYTYKQVFDQRFNFKKNDVIIITLTGLDREYFFEDRPNLGCDFFCGNKVSIEEIHAYKQYVLYLNENRNKKIVNLYNFIAMLNELSTKITTVVMACFFGESFLIESWRQEFMHVHTANGCLCRIEEKEFADKRILDELRRSYMDERISHMTRSNHNILAKKLLEYIHNRTNVDLTKGFKEGIINKDFIINKKLYDYETFQ